MYFRITTGYFVQHGLLNIQTYTCQSIHTYIHKYIHKVSTQQGFIHLQYGACHYATNHRQDPVNSIYEWLKLAMLGQAKKKVGGNERGRIYKQKILARARFAFEFSWWTVQFFHNVSITTASRKQFIK